jgi:hypothetical protein
VAFKLGWIEDEDSNLWMRGVADCPRMICAAPEYLDKYCDPKTTDEWITNK